MYLFSLSTQQNCKVERIAIPMSGWLYISIFFFNDKNRNMEVAAMPCTYFFFFAYRNHNIRVDVLVASLPAAILN